MLLSILQRGMDVALFESKIMEWIFCIFKRTHLKEK